MFSVRTYIFKFLKVSGENCYLLIAFISASKLLFVLVSFASVHLNNNLNVAEIQLNILSGIVDPMESVVNIIFLRMIKSGLPIF